MPDYLHGNGLAENIGAGEPAISPLLSIGAMERRAPARVRRQRCVLSFWFAHLHRSRTGQRDRRSTNSTGRLSQKRSVASVHKIHAGGSSQGSATYVPPPPTGFARVSDLGGLKCDKATQRRTFYTANDGRRDAAKLFRAQADR
jgi:hypothetical protein